MTGAASTTEYFSQRRPEILELIPLDCPRILDVGCGYGALGRALLARRSCTVHGVERNAEATQYLSGVYERFVIGGAEEAIDRLSEERYDCIVLADVLEHLVDPWRTLDRLTRLLTRNGVVVASIPNVRNFALILNLAVRGRWTYAEHGLLDRTHLRFFTREGILALFDDAGLTIEKMIGKRDRFRPAARLLVTLPALIVPDLAVCQFLVRARLKNRSR